MSTTLFMQEIRKAFYRVAAEAIDQGLLTPTERDTIRRRNTRKGGNWVRHLRNLCAYIKYKQDKRDHQEKGG